ncbi:MAG TPA: helix-turn-helix domain-containing protein, partial [Anaeromyxobacteraceae bacterium]|nr:helix-turn-helix domain-containing protein [Anaeromyxobacteraceae bacterium]
MAEIDPEVLERVRTWCAEAGRQALAAEIRAAIAPLGWDELLAVKALLADPPPARPLGPHALADIARGAPPDVAAERERAGRYAREGAARDRPAADGAAPSPRQRRAAAARGSRTPQVVVVRRARDRAPEPPPPPPALPSIEELRRPEARAVLERLVRRHGGRRARIASDLAAAWRRPDGGPPGEEDVSALMEHHGLARAFERRERDELLHALRAAGGVRPRAAGALGLDAPGLDAALARLGAAGDAERIREERRRELRARATLSERVHLLLDDPARLD